VSLNYPDRETWLAVRATPRKRADKMFFVSTDLRKVADGPDAGQVIMFGKGRSYFPLKDKPVRPGRARRERLRAEREVG